MVKGNSHQCYLCTNFKVEKCAPKGRRNHNGINPPVFHKFPSNCELKSKWMNICGLDEQIDNVSNLYICSNHFVVSDYIDLNARQFGGIIKLKVGSVPSVLVPIGSGHINLPINQMEQATFTSLDSTGGRCYHKSFNDEVSETCLEGTNDEDSLPIANITTELKVEQMEHPESNNDELVEREDVKVEFIEVNNIVKDVPDYLSLKQKDIDVKEETEDVESTSFTATDYNVVRFECNFQPEEQKNDATGTKGVLNKRQMSTEINDEFLLQCVSKYRPLYDKTFSGYKSLTQKENSWYAVANSLQVNVRAAKQRFKALREKYRREVAIEAKLRRCGAPPSARNTWSLIRFFKSMYANEDQHRDSTSNLLEESNSQNDLGSIEVDHDYDLPVNHEISQPAISTHIRNREQTERRKRKKSNEDEKDVSSTVTSFMSKEKPTKFYKFAQYIAAELQELPPVQADEMMDAITLTLLQHKKRLRQE